MITSIYKSEERDKYYEKNLEQLQQKLHIRGLPRSDDVQSCNQPCHRYGKQLPPLQVRERRTRKKSKNREGSQNTRQPGCDGRERSRFRNRNLRPHIEKPGKVTVSLAQKRVLAAVSRMRGSNLRIGHRPR